MATDPSPALEKAVSEPVADLITASDRRGIRILVVDDERSMRERCESILGDEGYRVDTVRDGDHAIRRLKSGEYQLLLVEQEMPGTGALEVLAAMRKHSPETLAVVMSEAATTRASVEARRAGAWDYLPTPVTDTQLLVLVERAAYRCLQLRARAADAEEDGMLTDGEVPILGVSEAMKAAVDRALKVAPTEASVFITGESGTGKELIARCIYKASRRREKAFVTVNCAALPEALLESELFGHRRGAFTGAVRDKPGLLEVADRGTFFLDELCEMPLSLQPKLLRVLQDGALRRVGSERDDATVDVRFLSATNREPEAAIADELLREDLYYRLRVIPIHLPPLRERAEDIPVLAHHFVQTLWRRHRAVGEVPPAIAPEGMDLLREYSWPGNVRELQNVIERVVVLSEPGDAIVPDDLFAAGEAGGSGVMDLSREGPVPRLSEVDLRRPYHALKQELTDTFERRYLFNIVSRSQGNMSEAARQAGIDRTTLYRLMEKHELSKDELT